MRKLAWWCWLALLVGVPITSFPMVEATIGGETVSPISLLPLTVVLALLVIPHALRGGYFPAEAGPLLLFLVVATVSTLAAGLLPLEPYKGQSILERSVRGLSTLAIGVGFYLAAALVPDDERKRRASLWALYAGAAIMLLWSAVQATYIFRGAPRAPSQLNQIHRLFSVRDLFRDRVTGLAYEPSWLGDQLVMLYLPLWIAGLASGWSIRARAGRIPWLELALTAVGVTVLALSKSRISTASLIVMIGLLGLVGLWRLGGRLGKRSAWPSNPTRLSVLSLRVSMVLLGLLLAVGLVLGALRLAADHDWRVRRIMTLTSQLPSIRAEHPYEWVYAVSDRVAFAERLVYWEAGLAPFNRHPWLGVGLGNAGFLFGQSVPNFGRGLHEIQQALDPANPNFPNPKNLWIRILSETGLIGMAAFLTWLLVLIVGSLALATGRKGMPKTLGVAALLALVGWIFEGFSLDTFALPHTWIMFGLLTSQIWGIRQDERVLPSRLKC